jgi:hypothetical protein
MSYCSIHHLARFALHRFHLCATLLEPRAVVVDPVAGKEELMVAIFANEYSIVPRLAFVAK